MIELQKLFPNLRRCTIVKAIGRMFIDKSVEQFLFACLNDTSLDEDTRLAAASALTFNSHPEIIFVLKNHQSLMNTVPGLSQRFFDDYHAQLSLKKLLASFYNIISGQKRKEILMEVLSLDSVVCHQATRYYVSSNNAEVRKAYTYAFVKLQNHMPYFQYKWNAYSSIPYSTMIEFARSDRDLQ